MEDDSVVASCAAIIIAAALKKKRKKRLGCVKTWLLKRDKKGAYNNIIQELRFEDVENYKRYLRMNTETFEELLHRVTPLLEKKSTTMRKPLRVAEKLACTLRFLATGESSIPVSQVKYFSIYSPSLRSHLRDVERDIFIISKYGRRVAQNI